jgi:FtsP/CotA-like multicopper oxidase with cupredoxin domain
VQPGARWSIIAATVAGLVMLFVLLRPDAAPEDGDSGFPSTPTVIPSASGSASSAQSPEPERTLLEVSFTDGAVQGPTRFTVTQGDKVRILVRADVTDEVHLHGYDLHADVAPGGPAMIDFVANVAGVFECELEDAGTLLFQLEIVP